jgi:uncharacterized protein (TIGR00369 family)
MTDIHARIAASYARQALLATLGATLERVEPGLVEIALPFSPAIAQQHGFVHAGAISTILDTACGYAALTRMPEDAAVLTTEFKINLLSPARGARFLARGRVVKAGRTLTVTQGECLADDGTTVAIMTATMIALSGGNLKG